MKLLYLFLPSIFFVNSLAHADQTDERLNGLFLTLSMSSDLPTIRATESQIWEIWFKHPNQDVEELMQIGMARMNYNRYADAMLIFTQLVDNFPDYAEGLGEAPISGITFDGNSLAFQAEVDAQGQSLTLDFTGSVDGDSMNGEFGSDFGAFGVSGDRQ